MNKDPKMVEAGKKAWQTHKQRQNCNVMNDLVRDKLDKLCRKHEIDVHLIDDKLTYSENISNLEQLTHKLLHKTVSSKRLRKESIKDLGESLRDMGFVESPQEEIERIEKKIGEKHYEEEI